MSRHRLYALLNRCEALLNKVKPTTAGYRLLQLDGIYIEDHNDYHLYIQLGTRFGDGVIVHHEGVYPARDDTDVIEALDRIARATVLDALADV